jgi:hypothetical protein
MSAQLLSDSDQALRERLAKMPLWTLFNVRETALFTGLTPGALSNRRALGMWPHPAKIPGAGRMVRYRHGDLLASVGPADRPVHDADTHKTPINP